MTHALISAPRRGPREHENAFLSTSYGAFHHRRLIRRFLAGDLKDGMDDKGKTMFPMNCECNYGGGRAFRARVG